MPCIGSYSSREAAEPGEDRAPQREIRMETSANVNGPAHDLVQSRTAYKAVRMDGTLNDYANVRVHGCLGWPGSVSGRVSEGYANAMDNADGGFEKVRVASLRPNENNDGDGDLPSRRMFLLVDMDRC